MVHLTNQQLSPLGVRNEALGRSAKRKPPIGGLKAPPRGDEQSQDSRGNAHGEGGSGTVCGTAKTHPALNDADLLSIIEAWPKLDDSTKAGIVAIVRVAGG